MASAQVVETLVANNSPSQDSNHPDDHFQSRYVTPGFKPFSQVKNATSSVNCVVCVTCLSELCQRYEVFNFSTASFCP